LEAKERISRKINSKLYSITEFLGAEVIPNPIIEISIGNGT